MTLATQSRSQNPSLGAADGRSLPRSKAHQCATGRHCIADRLGVLAAAACAVHCLAAPIVLAILPVVGGVWASPKTHWVFAAISLPTALSLLWRSASRHSQSARRALIGLASTGAMLVLIGLAAPGAEWSKDLSVQIPLPASGTPQVAAHIGGDHAEEVRAWAASQGSAAPQPACEDECCASITTGAGGERNFALPFASIVTMLGGVLLVTAHALALRGRHASKAA